MDFQTQYRKPVRFYQKSGSQFADTYQLTIDDNGKQDLTKVGRIDTYERIQSWKESCDIKSILARFVNGDQTALDRNLPLFGDFTDAPSSLADYYQKIMEAEQVFNSLDVNTRAKFNHSPSEFFASIGTDRFFSILGYSPNKEADLTREVIDKEGDSVE